MPLFPEHHLDNFALITYRNTFIALDVEQFLSGYMSFVLPTFMYDDSNCVESISNKCRFRSELFRITSCSNAFGNKFECLANDEDCIDYQNEYCNVTNNIPNILFGATAILEDVSETISDTVGVIVNTTIVKPLHNIKNIKDNIIHSTSNRFQRAMYAGGIINFDCKLLNHPDVHILYNHCVLNNNVNVTLYHIEFEETAYFIRPINSTLNDTNFLNLLEKSIGYDTSEGESVLLFRFLYYNPGDWTFYFKIVGTVLENSGYGVRPDYLPFNHADTQYFKPITGLLFLDRLISSVQLPKFLSYVVVLAASFYVSCSNYGLVGNTLRMAFYVAIIFLGHSSNTFGFSYFFGAAFGFSNDYVIWAYVTVFIGAVANLHSNLRTYKLNYGYIFMDSLNIFVSFVCCVLTYPAFFHWALLILAVSVIVLFYTKKTKVWDEYVHDTDAFEYIHIVDTSRITILITLSVVRLVL